MGHEAVRLRGSALDHLDRIEPVRLARVGELERERDVDGAEGVLVQLHQLGGLGRGDAVQALAGVAQHARGARRALLRDAAQHTRGLQLLVVAHAGVDPLGGERHEHVLTDPQTALGERLGEQLAGGAHVRGRGQHQRLPGTGVAHDRGARLTQDPRVGPQLLVDGRGHADQHQVGGVERLDAVGEHEPVARQVVAQVALFRLQQLGLPIADRAQAGAADVDPDDPAAGAPQRDRGRQPDVAEPDDGDDGVAGALGAVWSCAAAGSLGRGVHDDWLWDGGGGLRHGGGPLLARGGLNGAAGDRQWPCRMAARRPSCTALGRLVDKHPKE